jgi:hypothetical protein
LQPFELTLKGADREEAKQSMREALVTFAEVIILQAHVKDALNIT